MAEIFHNPMKIVLMAILLAIEIPAIIILAVCWVKAWKEAKERGEEDGT